MGNNVGTIFLNICVKIDLINSLFSSENTCEYYLTSANCTHCVSKYRAVKYNYNNKIYSFEVMPFVSTMMSFTFYHTQCIRNYIW